VFIRALNQSATFICDALIALSGAVSHTAGCFRWAHMRQPSTTYTAHTYHRIGTTTRVQPCRVQTDECASRSSAHRFGSSLLASNDDATSSRTSHAPSLAAATAVALGSAMAAASLLMHPLPAFAKARMTPDEQLNISIFKISTPSVVNVTNLAVRRDQFTTSMMEIPQGAGSGFIWDKAGHVVTNYHVISDASDVQVTMAGRLLQPAPGTALAATVQRCMAWQHAQAKRRLAGCSGCILWRMLHSHSRGASLD
jgi:hypothetical protein